MVKPTHTQAVHCCPNLSIRLTSPQPVFTLLPLQPRFFGYLLLLGNDELESFLNILLRDPQHPMSLPPQLLRTLENLRDQAKDAVWALSSCLCQQTPKIKINGRTCEFMGDFKTWMNSGVWGGWTGRGRGLGRYNRTLT